MSSTIADAAMRRVYRAPVAIDLFATLGPMQRGTGDPTYQVVGGAIWRAIRTPDGVATLRVVNDRDGSAVAAAWGPGAGWALETLPELLGARDEPAAFRPNHPLLRDVWRRRRGWRVPRSGLVLEALLPAVLEQKVTGTEAWRAWRYLVRRFGEPAPGPAGVVPASLRVAPEPAGWSRIPSWEWHRAGVDATRSRTAIGAAVHARRLEETTTFDTEAASARLQALPGIGAWTAAEVAQRALGDADAVSVGDYHLPSMVGWALVGERVDDDRMLELLEPYRGHRYRVVRLIELSGVRPPRHGPRLAPRGYRAI